VVRDTDAAHAKNMLIIATALAWPSACWPPGRSPGRSSFR
jgi:hypothetical protein